MTTATAEVYLAAIEVATAVLAHRRVQEAWERPSALPAMSVGAVCAHLAGQVDNVLSALAQDTTDHEPIGLLSHYAMVPWREQDGEGSYNAGIRERGELAALQGHERVIAQLREGTVRLGIELERVEGDHVVLLPWTGWALTLDNLLLTRLLETVVHTDDLAASVRVKPPVFDDVAIMSVIDLLTRLAVKRHGATAVLRTLSRSERAPRSITAL